MQELRALMERVSEDAGDSSRVGLLLHPEGLSFRGEAREIYDESSIPYPLRTHILRLLGPKTLLFKAFGLV